MVLIQRLLPTMGAAARTAWHRSLRLGASWRTDTGAKGMFHVRSVPVEMLDEDGDE